MTAAQRFILRLNGTVIAWNNGILSGDGAMRTIVQIEIQYLREIK